MAPHTYSLFVDRAIGLIALRSHQSSREACRGATADRRPARQVGRCCFVLISRALPRLRISDSGQAAVALVEAMVGDASSARLLGDREPV